MPSGSAARPEEPAAPALVRVREVSKTFGVVRALDRVSLDMRSGEILALVGENGAGKSTLMRILEGEHRPDGGEILFEGRPVAFASARDAHRLGIRVIHQEPEIIPDLSVAENIFIGELRGPGGLLFDRRDLERRTLALLDQFGVAAELPPWRLCTHIGPAQRQLIEIMRALKAGERLLALDEPTSSLTAEETQRLFVLLRRLRAQGVAIVYISHRLREVRELADRIAVLRDGQLVAVTPAAETSEEQIVRSMVGRPISALFNHRSHAREAPVLEVEHLTTRHVTDVSLTVRAGEIVGLAGLIGAGRSELARGIFGFDAATGGRVLVGGREVRLRSPADAILAGMGFAPEDRKHEALLLARSVRENIALCVPDRISRFGFVRWAAEHTIAADLAGRLRVKTPSLSQLVSKLSGGNQQKVVLGRWLARQPRLLILDEPTRGIDVGAKAEIYRLVEELAEAGLGVLFISSELPELLGMTDRILVMARGRLVGELATVDATEETILALAMHGNLSS
jgi:L-arabinose transport system ATP-binding protein